MAVGNSTSQQEAVANGVDDLYRVAAEELAAAEAIIDAAAVLCALDRAPVHQDTHPSHNIRTGGGYAHGERLANGTLPVLLNHARCLIGSALNDAGVMRERAVTALLEGGRQ